jgi:hypothetical protein
MFWPRSGQTQREPGCGRFKFNVAATSARTNMGLMKCWETIANRLTKAGWILRLVSAVDCQGRKIWIVAAHRDDGRRFIVHADEKLGAFVELERVSRESLRFPNVE